MDSNKLIVTVLMSFSLFGLSACKQGGNNSKTSIRKTRAGTNGQKATNGQTGPGTNTGTGTGGTKGSDSKTIVDTNGDAGEGVIIGGKKAEQASCASVAEKAKANGWKINSIEVPETKGSAKKLKITYFTLEKSSDLSNPVIYFNRNAFQNIKDDDLEKLAKVATDFKVDFVLMDMRGSGCSSAMPDIKTKTSELNNYGSKNAVADAEEIRKVVLKDSKEKKWKIMAHQSGGIVALRYVQLFPEAVKSIHIADFYPEKNQAKLFQARIEKEAELWKTIAEQEKVSDETVAQAMKNLEASKCTGLASCKTLIDLLGGSRISYKQMWPTIAKQVKDIAEDKAKVADLMKVFEGRKAMNDKISAARILDVDSDKSLSACATVLKTNNKGVINSCRLDVEVRKGESAALKNLNHDKLDMPLIIRKLKDNEIEYHLFAAKASALYSSDGYKDHEEEMGDLLKNTYEIVDDGSEVYLNTSFLKGLQ